MMRAKCFEEKGELEQAIGDLQYVSGSY